MIETLIIQSLCAAVFVGTAAASYLVTPRMIGLSRRLNLLDIPNERKAHAAPTPLLGGCGLFISFWLVVLAGLAGMVLFQKQIVKQPELWNLIVGALHLLPRLGGIFLGSVFILFLGLLDDVFNLAPWQKLLGQSIAAYILISKGITIDIVLLEAPFGYAVTFVWILLIMNSFNFIDSIDGHCAGIALISCVVFFWTTQIIHQPAVGLFVIGLVGVLFGFLPYNFKPARIFLGDNGSLFVGYMMAATTLLLTYQTVSTTAVTRFIPIFMFGVPIYDTLSVILVRVFRGIPPWRGDRNHFAHRLSRLGMSDKVAVFFSYFVALTLGIIAVLSTQIVTAIGAFLIVFLFASIMVVIAFLEYYAAMHVKLNEELRQQFKRRRDDVREEEDKRF